MDQWTDEEIREALRKHNICQGIPLTSSTRPFLLTKLKNVLSTPSSSSASEPDSTDDSVEAETSKPVSVQTITSSTPVEPEGYFGVVAVLHTPKGESDAAVQLSPFYTSKSDALKAIKGLAGARFKKFDSQAAAEEFSQKNVVEEVVEKTDSPSTIPVPSPVKQSPSERANNFPGVKTQDLSMFRIMIEEGDVESFLDCVQRNPRYLITAGDAPEILKPPTRYNALHSAVISGQLEICKHLLWILQNDDFWTMVYPDDTDVVRSSRKEHLLDLYLNMQDKGFGETPLHFACKLGHSKIVSLLLTSPLTNTSIKNKDGKTPSEVICQKAPSPSPEVKARIEELLREPEIYYVPVLRTEDNSTPPRLGHPVTLGQLDDLESQTDGCELPEMSNGLAGPMSPSDAKQFYQEWRSPGRGSSEGKELARIKRSDSERGLERVGRQLAHKGNIGWMEYWDFLGCSCDLSKPKGMAFLEEYLESRASSIELPAEDLESPLLCQPTGDALDVGDSDSVSRRLFKGEEMEEAGVMMAEPQAKSSDIDELSDLFSKKVSLENSLFISGSAPTKLDHDVFRALCGISPDPSKYPYITKWLGLLDGFSEEEKKSWRTPRKQPLGVSHTPSSHPVSPLVFSSPSMQTYGGSSPLVTSGASQSKSMSSSNSHTMTPTFRYRPTTPRGRNASTTPRRHGQARVMTPNRYGKLSFTPRVI